MNTTGLILFDIVLWRLVIVFFSKERLIYTLYTTLYYMLTAYTYPVGVICTAARIRVHYMPRWSLCVLPGIYVFSVVSIRLLSDRTLCIRIR